MEDKAVEVLAEEMITPNVAKGAIALMVIGAGTVAYGVIRGTILLGRFISKKVSK
ncbi:MAG: hypothetical protein PHY48_15400 [Candidatus Cloacimonetes bacterium]|nr:hypothetical protein [Candidatus Cloacimonadota bacterium]